MSKLQSAQGLGPNPTCEVLHFEDPATPREEQHRVETVELIECHQCRIPWEQHSCTEVPHLTCSCQRCREHLSILQLPKATPEPSQQVKTKEAEQVKTRNPEPSLHFLLHTSKPGHQKSRNPLQPLSNAAEEATRSSQGVPAQNAECEAEPAANHYIVQDPCWLCNEMEGADKRKALRTSDNEICLKHSHKEGEPKITSDTSDQSLVSNLPPCELRNICDNLTWEHVTQPHLPRLQNTDAKGHHGLRFVAKQLLLKNSTCL